MLETFEIVNSIKEGVRYSLDLASNEKLEKTEREMERLKRQIKAQMWKKGKR